nr:uncharacterized protein LOC111508656 isoform X2 [Leptinotarsa decemlineata]
MWIYRDLSVCRKCQKDEMINGSWNGYKKANMFFNLSCLTYNITCADKECIITMIRNYQEEPGNASYAIQLTNNGSFVMNNYHEFYFNISQYSDYNSLIVWKVGPVSDYLFVLMKDQNKDMNTEIDKTILKYNIKNTDIKKIDHSQCGSGNKITFSPILLVLSVHIITLFVSRICT